MRPAHNLFLSFLSRFWHLLGPKARGFLIFIIPNEDPWPVFADWIAAYMNDLAIKAMKALATAFWFLEKIAAGITRLFLEENMWDLIIIGVFSELKSSMPEILQNILFPAGFDTAGLLYLVISMAGLLMIIPGIDHKRLIDPRRVILWAIVVSSFFIVTSVGYDLVGTIEKLRADTTQIIIGTEDRKLDDLVSKPMMANDSDLEDYSFVLSNNFEEEYFPEPEDGDYENREAEIIDGPLITWKMNVKVEKESSQRNRREKAQTGLAISGLTIIGAVVLIMIAFILATLTASAIILIIFFLISLPVGFFEFGSAIISGIVKQYTYIWAITFLAAILPSILIAANTLVAAESELSSIMQKVPMFIIVAIATSYVSAMAGQAMLDTFSIISTSISTAMAPLNYAGSMPQGGVLGGGPLQAGANVAATAVLAAATGGTSAALMAGGGALIGQVSERGGQAAGAVATGMMGQKASVFATAARGRGATQVAQIAGTYRRRQKQRRERDAEQSGVRTEAAGKKFSSKTHAPEDSIPEEERHFVNAGSYLTLQTTDLERAEQAFGRGQYTSARHYLTRAFGSRQVANQAMRQYRQHGRQGMRKVRDIASAAQATAQEMTINGEALFDAKGNLTNDFRKRTWATLSKRRSIDASSQEDAALGAQIAGATVRQPTDIWRDPFATRQLARHIKQNPENDHPYSQDAAAVFALHDMAVSQGWGEQQLEAIFEATREAQARAHSGQQVGIDAIAQQMNMHGELADSLPGTRREAARLAMLILGQTKAAKRPVRPVRTKPNAKELAQKTSVPDSPQVTPNDEMTETAIDDLNKLAAAQGWTEDELTTLFEATDDILALPAGENRVNLINKKLATTKEYLMTKDEIRKQAAGLALRISHGTKLAPNAAPASAPSAASASAAAVSAPSTPAASAAAASAPSIPAASAAAASAPSTASASAAKLGTPSAAAASAAAASAPSAAAASAAAASAPSTAAASAAAASAPSTASASTTNAPAPSAALKAAKLGVPSAPTKGKQEWNQTPPESPEWLDLAPPEPPEWLDQAPPEWLDQAPPEWLDQAPPEPPEWLDQAPPEPPPWPDQAPPEPPESNQAPPEPPESNQAPPEPPPWPDQAPPEPPEWLDQAPPESPESNQAPPEPQEWPDQAPSESDQAPPIPSKSDQAPRGKSEQSELIPKGKSEQSELIPLSASERKVRALSSMIDRAWKEYEQMENEGASPEALDRKKKLIDEMWNKLEALKPESDQAPESK